MNQRPREEIAAVPDHLGSVSKAPWMDRLRHWWPRYLFHCTDVRNVVNVLKRGELLSRPQVDISGSLLVDIADPGIIDRTDPKSKEFVRLYFRPGTPTQFLNEGFQSKQQFQDQAHCPVPVYLLFDEVVESQHVVLRGSV